MESGALYFNPRSPYGERRCASFDGRRGSAFQSTLPVRGATSFPCYTCEHKGISIHAPRTGSDQIPSGSTNTYTNFNPRSPYGERRQIVGVVRPNYQFQSTLPVRGATAAATGLFPSFAISIHAPRTGSDPRSAPSFRWWVISIHAPRTGSDPAPTLPGQSGLLISIHAPRTGSDIAAAS